MPLVVTIDQAFENRIAAMLGDRYVWALHTEPVRILMRRILELELEAAAASAGLYEAVEAHERVSGLMGAPGRLTHNEDDDLPW